MARSNFVITIIFTIFIFTSTGFTADKYQWKLVDTENECKIYTSTVPGKGYIAAKATCLFPARIETVGVALRDIANYPNWMEDCSETKILKEYDAANDGFIFWYRQNIPLQTDRDMVLKSKTDWDFKKGKNVIYADMTEDVPYDSGKGYIKMRSFSSVWTLQWVDREHTMVTFMIDPDLGDGLPVSIANSIIKTNPLKSLKKMMKIVKEKKYIEAGKKSKYVKLVEEAIKGGHLK